MKISKKTREQAATICAIAASSEYASDAYNLAADAIGAGLAALALANDAWGRATNGGFGGEGDDLRADDAEAEALLRTGWTP